MFPEFFRTSCVPLCVVIFISTAVQAQHRRLLTSFGPVIERSLDAVPVDVCVTASPGGGRPVIAVLCQEHPILRFYLLNDSAHIVDNGTVDLPALQQSLAVVDVDSNGAAEYVTLNREGNQVTVFHRKGMKYRHTAISVDANAQGLAIADFDNDGKKDILLFGKTMTGIATLVGKSNGTFAKGPLLFPEISVSDVKTTDINGDGIVDVVLLNWLSNQLMVYYGISRGIFSEQVSMVLQGEPGRLAIGLVSRKRTMRLAVTLSQERQVTLMTIDATGEIEIDGAVECPGVPHGVYLGQVNNDSWADLVAVTDKGTVVALGASRSEFGPPTIFGPGVGSRSWAVADVDGDRHPDLVLADQIGRRLVILGNSEPSGRLPWPDVYAVGVSPRGLAVRDFDGDGRADICVANSGSSTVSFLLNRGNTQMSGQISVSVPAKPAFVTTASQIPGREQMVITAHPQLETIGVLALSDTIPRSATFAVPTGPNPNVVFARIDSASGRLSILVRNHTGRDGPVSLSLFQQLARGQFLERSLRANLPERILALTVDDFTGNKGYDLAFVTNNRAKKQTTVSLATGTSGFDFDGIRQLFTYSDSLSTTRMILAGRVNEDSYADLVLVVGAPQNSLAIAYGKGDGTFRDSLEWVRDVRPMRDDEIVIRDVNDDGLNDIVVLDADRNEVIGLYGIGGGRFAQPVAIAPGKGVTGLAVARLRKLGEEDLMLSYGDRGVVSIIVAPFSKGQR